MADSATVRITGPVIALDVREGEARDSGRPYRMVTARVLVVDGIAEATLPASMAEPTRGEVVDWVGDVTMDVSERFGASLRIRVRGPFEDSSAPALNGSVFA